MSMSWSLEPLSGTLYSKVFLRYDYVKDLEMRGFSWAICWVLLHGMCPFQIHMLKH